MSNPIVRPRQVTVEEYADRSAWSSFRSAVSLHAHTYYSCEMMDFLPRYADHVPFLARWIGRRMQDHEAREGWALDFSRVWWHPPVSPRQVFESEADQIERRFGLGPIVSVTDHDDITAAMDLQLLYANPRAPISFEWTVPCQEGYFHVGVHNLPPEEAWAWFHRLEAVTAGTTREAVRDVFADLHARADVLIVLNHPCWDLANVGSERHEALLREFIRDHRLFLHAVELNGYRAARENARARAFASHVDLPLISGGDRHACAPNALVNVTRATSFGEFAAEIRAGVSHVVFMPEYRQHIVTRTLASISEVLRQYPGYPVGRQHWTDRVTFDARGELRTLSVTWPNGGPLPVRWSVRGFQFVMSPAVFPLLRRAFERLGGPASQGAAEA